MGNKLYEIKNGSVTLYVEHYKDKEFRLKGFTVEADTESYFTDYYSTHDKFPDNRVIVPIGDYLYRMYKSEADEQLKMYLYNNIQSYDFYSTYDEDGFPFWKNIINSAGSEPKLEYRRFELDFRDVTGGIVGITINNVICKYDFAEQKSLDFTLSNYYSTIAVNSTMDVFYRNHIYELLALEQYRKGISVPAYSELVRLREFLKEKKSLKFVMKSGAVHEIKKDTINNADIISHHTDNGKLRFSLNNSYHLKPNIQRNMPIDELEYLQYGKCRYYINTDNLSNYSEPEKMKGRR